MGQSDQGIKSLPLILINHQISEDGRTDNLNIYCTMLNDDMQKMYIGTVAQKSFKHHLSPTFNPKVNAFSAI